MNKYIEIRSSTVHGIGVFARIDIKAGEIFETCDVFPLIKEIELPEELATLQYPWDEENYGLCISGAGSFFNHSKDANAKIHDRDFDNNIQRYSAVRNIAKGEEVTIFYNEDFEEFINKVAT